MAMLRRHLVVALLVVLSARAAAVDPNTLAKLVNDMLRKFQVHSGLPMFSMAVSIPPGVVPGSYDLSRVQELDVKKTILDCNVYEGNNVLAATVLRWPDVAMQCPRAQVPWQDVLRACRQESMTWHDVAMKCPGAVKDGQSDHAEYRVLEKFSAWATNKDKSGLLVFYVYTTPCEARCAKRNNALSILRMLQGIQGWNEHVLVFSKLVKPKSGTSIPVDRLKRALSDMGKHIGGLENIFRCQFASGAMTCSSCSTLGQISPQCYLDEGDLEGVGQPSGAQGPVGGQGVIGTEGQGGRGAGGWAQRVGGAEDEWQTVGQRRGGNGPTRGQHQRGKVAVGRAEDKQEMGLHEGNTGRGKVGMGQEKEEDGPEVVDDQQLFVC
ncbi:uncharacterized protein LOC119122597 isoform X2 [Syngnathus acus]|uniref:uncharacterized protein LOC119122597 isoform X2 n=1 Tax=Syngnathus acus TaxID=161584 RepID=UPI001885BCE7|nr:uncharacterized protein LOC119122597 isoform X2 [Syngnathus acus]